MAPTNPTRRQVLRTGGLGVAAAAFLAACGSKEIQAGQSGAVPSSTSTPPTVPPSAPTTEALAEDTTLLRTGTSLELLAADLYDTYGPKLDDRGWQVQATRLADDHRRAASVFAASTAATKRVDKPNEYVQENDIDPVTDTLIDDDAILGLFRDVESTLVSTYISAAGTFTSAAWRARVMTFGSASARRVTVLANGGEGAIPTDALYPLTDLISNDAYVLAEPKKADDSG